jgi:hypothetical protein
MSGEATLRVVVQDGATYVHADDVAALLLDTAQTVEQHPTLTAADVLRSLAAGLAAHEASQS